MGRITSRGFELFFYEDILAEKIAYIQARIPGMTTDDSNPIINLLKVESEQDAQLSQTMNELYESRCITTASGMALEKFVSVLNLTRRRATNSYGDVTFSGDLGSTIPKGTQVSTNDGMVYVTLEDATVGATLTVDAEVISVSTGLKSRTGANTVVKIVSPIAGVRTVNNSVAITGGLDVETDAQLRLRWFDALSKLGKATLLSLLNRVRSIENVTSVSIVENTSHLPDADGRPGHCFETYVLGGDDDDIWEALLDTKPAGINAHGTETKIFTDGTAPISFTRVTPISIEFNVRLYTKPTWTPMMETEIKNRLVSLFQFSEIGGIVSFSTFLDALYDDSGSHFSKFDNFEFVVKGNRYGLGDEVTLSNGEIADIVPGDINITYI